MDGELVVQGRSLTPGDLALIRGLVDGNPSWHRTRLSRQLCEMWGWRAANGRPKDMACRSMLLKLERRGLISLPARRRAPVNELRNVRPARIRHAVDAIDGPLDALRPVSVELVRDGEALKLFRLLLCEHHYLGYRNSVGENLKYLVRDRAGRPIACLLFGSAAWRAASRDALLGWNEQARRRNLPLVTNNTRFLILPWVRVPCLATHVLGLVQRRVAADWVAHYGHPVVLLETFVDSERFHGTCYRAANWLHVGRTTGRSRNDRNRSLSVAPKDIYLLPLHRHFVRLLQQEGPAER
jgi:hypothetical protein